MMNQEENIVEEREEILTFHEEGEVSRVQIEHPQNDLLKLQDLDDVISNDVVGFLERPIHHANFEWLATSPDAVELTKEVSLPGDWILSSMIREKLSGFRYLQCDFKIRVQVNAQPFNAGYLMMTYIPLHRQNTLTPTNVTTFSGLTGYRRVMLDLSQDTSAEITVPYNNIVSHFDLVNGVGYLGVVKLYVYSPLTGSDNVDGTVWITAQNVKVSLPTGLPVKQYVPIPDSGPAHAGSPNTKKDQNLRTGAPKEQGAVSKVATAVGSVAGVLKDVPVIGSVASSVEWAANAVGSVASFFGFSKPIDTGNANKQTLVIANNFANYDGDSKAKSLAFYSCNETQIPTETFGTDQDEMSFSHILAQPNYLTRFKMRKVDTQNTVIWKWPVDPLSCQKSIAVNENVAPYIPGRYICQNTYLSLLSQFFKYYRGSIRYHIKIVKTPFHSGRIRLFVVPGATVETDLASIDFNKVHSEVYDIRDTTEFDVEVPYKWNTPWKALDSNFTSQQPAPANLTPNTPTAMIYIQVVNALRNPSTCADLIDFVVETSAANDFQFAVPQVQEATRVIPSEEGLREQFPAQPSNATGIAHSGVQILDNKGGDQMISNKIAVGEVVTGWRTLLKRYARFLIPYEVEGKWAVEPWDTVAVNNNVDVIFDFFSICDLLYRFKTGSVRVAAKIIQETNRNVITHEVAPHDSLDTQPDTTAAVLQSAALEPVVELSVPFYQQTIALPTALGQPTVTGAVAPGNYTAVPYNTGTHVRSDAKMEWWRATGEDFSFGYLVGAPKTLTVYQTQACDLGWREILNRLQDVPTYTNWYGPSSESKWEAYVSFLTQNVEAAWRGVPLPEQLQYALNTTVFRPTAKAQYMTYSDAPSGSTIPARNFVSQWQRAAKIIIPIFRSKCSV